MEIVGKRICKSKSCSAKNIEQDLSKFYKNGKYFSSNCKLCISLYGKSYYQDNKPEILKNTSTYRENNKLSILFKAKVYRENNKDSLANKYRLYYKANKEFLKVYISNYRLINKDSLRIKRRLYRNKLYSNASFRLKKNISRIISFRLKSSKCNESTSKYFEYSFSELKLHLESLFEPWMSWKNYGLYNSKTWDDNNSSTWSWQLDHITPQSDLPYTSMVDINFKKCWSLDNLRPYSAKQNVLDGANRTRHKK